jgi:hypothetical protein
METVLIMVLGMVFVVLVIALTETMVKRREDEAERKDLELLNDRYNDLVISANRLTDDSLKTAMSWQHLTMFLEKDLARKEHRKVRTIEQLKEML